MINRFLLWLFTPSKDIASTTLVLTRQQESGILEFTTEDLKRPEGWIEDVPFVGQRRWRVMPLYWEVLDTEGRVIGIICPDHERAVGHPTYEALLSIIRGGK